MMSSMSVRRVFDRLIRTCYVGLLLTVSLLAEVEGPVLGYLVSSGALRSILGIPGATTWGETLVDVSHLEPVAISNLHGYALGIAESGEIILLTSLATSPQATVLDASSDPVSQVVLSPAETAAAFYSSDGAIVAVWSGFPQTPRLLWTGTEPDRIHAMAVSDDGAIVLGVTAEQGLWAIASEGARYLASVGPSASITFLTGGCDAVIADDAANEIRLLRAVVAAPTLEPLAGQREGVVAPVAVAVSGDNRYIVVANSPPHGILMIRLEDRNVRKLTCPCAPAKLDRLSGTAAFRLTDEPLHVLDGDLPQPRIISVPPPNQTGGSQ